MSLELTGIRFGYPRQPDAVLQDFSLRIESGESVAIMAPSGAGKSTVLGIAGLLLKPQAGRVQLSGEDVTVRDARRLRGIRISQVFQSSSLLSRRTVLDNILLPALINGRLRAVAERDAEELAAGLGIDGLVGRRVNEISGGQAQRVGIARALCTSPHLVIADEPTANLDQHTAAEVARLLFAVRRAESILMVATHDPAVAALADRTIRLGTDERVSA